MSKKTIKELAEILYVQTVEATNVYFKTTKKKKMDKQLWAWLHIGFLSGIVECGYTEKEAMEVIALTKSHIKESQIL